MFFELIEDKSKYVKVNVSPLKDSMIIEIFMDIEIKYSDRSILLNIQFSAETHANEFKHLLEGLQKLKNTKETIDEDVEFQTFFEDLYINVKRLNYAIPKFDVSILVGEENSESMDTHINFTLDEESLKRTIGQLKSIIRGFKEHFGPYYSDNNTEY